MKWTRFAVSLASGIFSFNLGALEDLLAMFLGKKSVRIGRLRKLYPKIIKLRDILVSKEDSYVDIDRAETHIDPGSSRTPMSVSFYSKAKELSYTLDKLKIPYPELIEKDVNSQENWRHFLIELAPLAEANDLFAAQDLSKGEDNE